MNKIIISGVPNSINQDCIQSLINAGIDFVDSKSTSKMELLGNFHRENWLNSSFLTDDSSFLEDENPNYILFYSSPEFFLSSEKINFEKNDYKKLLSIWLKSIEETLSFYFKNLKNSILVDVEQCVNNLEPIIELLKNKFKVSFEDVHCKPKNIDKSFPFVMTNLKKSMCMGFLNEEYQLQEIYEEVNGAADLIDGTVDITPDKRALVYARNSIVEIETINLIGCNIQNEHLDLVNDYELESLQVKQLQEELELVYKKQSKLVLSNKGLEKEKDELKNENLDVSAANEISLLQINQLQEELEYYFILSQSFKFTSENKNAIQFQDERYKKSLQLSRHLN